MKRVVTKAVMVERLMEDCGFNRLDAHAVVESFFKTIRTTLSQGVSIKLSGFGNFILRDKKERPGRNPKTGEPVAISARRVVIFRPGMKLRKCMKYGMLCSKSTTSVR